MSKSALSTFEFDRFRIDPNQRVLFKDGRPLTLPPKVFQTLLLLVESQGQVVSKEDFFARVWSDTVVEESNLTWNIHTIRKSLGETPKKRFIVTVPKVGFRFEEPVRVIVSTAAAVPAKKTPLPEDAPSIGVLPFLNIGGNPENEYLSDGIAEEMIDVLARTPGLRVAARTSSFAFRGRDADIQTIADVLGVNHLIEGSVRKSETRIRVSVRLFGVNEGYIWTQVFESQPRDMLDMQDDIARSVADKLRVNLGVVRLPASLHRSGVDPDAHNHLLLGRYFWNRRTEDSLKRAAQNFEAALRLEPRYALAHAGLADVFNTLGMYRMIPSKDAFSKARQAALLALEIDPDLAEAHTAMGIVSNWWDWDWTAGEAHFLKALEAKPHYALAHQWYSLSLPIAERIQDSIDEMCKALQLEPLSLGINASLCWIYFIARESDRAIQQGLITLELDQQFSLALYSLGLSYTQKGMFQEGVATLRELRKAQATPATISGLGWALGRAGDKEGARQHLQELMELSKTSYVSAYDIAIVHSGMEDADKAVEWLDRAVQDRGWLNHLHVNPLFDPIRGDLRFQQLLSRIRR